MTCCSLTSFLLQSACFHTARVFGICSVRNSNSRNCSCGNAQESDYWETGYCKETFDHNHLWMWLLAFKITITSLWKCIKSWWTISPIPLSNHAWNGWSHKSISCKVYFALWKRFSWDMTPNFYCGQYELFHCLRVLCNTPHVLERKKYQVKILSVFIIQH